MIIKNLDCFEFLKDIENNSVNAVIIDPPYSILTHKIEDNFNINQIEELAKEFKRILTKNHIIAYFGKQPTLTTWNSIFMQYFKFKKEIVWYKKSGSNPFGKVQNVYENISIFGNLPFLELRKEYVANLLDYTELRGGSSLNKIFSEMCNIIKEENWHLFTNNVNKAKAKNRDNHLNYSNADNRRFQHFKAYVKGALLQDLIIMGGQNKNNIKIKSGEAVSHPTVKPIELIEILIAWFFHETENIKVIDCFLGSGTTALACKNLNMNGYNIEFLGCEILEEYYKLSLKRLNEFVTQPTLFTKY